MSTIAAITYTGAAATTPSNTTTDSNGPFAGFVVTATGTVSLVLDDGTTLTLPSITASATPYPYAFRRVNLTGTTATVVGLYAQPLYKGGGK